jgi:hypothetical protein
MMPVAVKHWPGSPIPGTRERAQTFATPRTRLDQLADLFHHNVHFQTASNPYLEGHPKNPD